MKTIPGHNAFPIALDCDDCYDGLNKREWFAGLALQGLLSNICELRKHGWNDNEIEEFACMRADALIEQLNYRKP